MSSSLQNQQAAHPGRGIVLFLLTGFCFAILDATAKYLTREYSVMQIAWARYFFALLFMMPYLTRGRGRNPLASARPFLQVVRGILLMLVTTFFFLVFSYMPLADATSIGFTTPLIVTALGALVLGEKVGPRSWTAVILGFGGVLIIVQPGAGTFHWAGLLAVGLAATNAVFQIMTRAVSRYDSAYVCSFYGAFIGALVLSVVAPFFWRTPDLFGWVLLIFIGALGSFTHYIFAAALGHAPASTLAPYTYGQLLWASLLGFILFSDVPGLSTIIGGTIIVASGIYVFSREAALRRAARETGA
jgi:drug/metabolite transporter (DMT)-like permease